MQVTHVQVVVKIICTVSKNGRSLEIWVTKYTQYTNIHKLLNLRGQPMRRHLFVQLKKSKKKTSSDGIKFCPKGWFLTSLSQLK